MRRKGRVLFYKAKTGLRFLCWGTIMKKIILCIIITGSLAASAAANARIPYAQALAICKGRAAQAMTGPLIYPHGLIGVLAMAASDGQRQADIMNGCLAEYGWVVQ
jgi:hypothetical protein